MSDNTLQLQPVYNVGDIVWVIQSKHSDRSSYDKLEGIVYSTVKIIEVHCHTQKRNAQKMSYITYRCEMLIRTGPMSHKFGYISLEQYRLFRTLSDAMANYVKHEFAGLIYERETLSEGNDD